MPQDTQSRRSSGGNRRRGAGGRPASKRATGATTASKTKPSNIKPLTPTLEPPDIESFAEFALEPAIHQAIADMGITKPTPIQALAIAPVLAGKDIIAKAETGTGKTLAFGAPMISKIDPSRASVLGLVLSPTRELAEQVHDVLEKLGAAKGIKTALVVGGEQMGPQVKKLQAGAQVVVGTPGRVLDLLNQRFLQFPWTEFAVLDEADKMLEIGFIDDVKKILDACNEYRQTLLFSATFPTPLLELARSYTNDPVEVATSMGVSTVDTINQYVLRCSEENRARELAHMIEDSAPDDVFLVFCERRTDVDQLMRQLERRRFSVKALHGGYDQAARFRVMGAFRTGEVKCLVATDVASRGLDVKHVTHVVNLGIPRDVSDYTHRIGRTGRAGAQGVAVTFVARKDERGYRELLETSGFDIEEIERPRDIFARERVAARVREDAKAEAERTATEVPDAPEGTDATDDAPRGRRARTRGTQARSAPPREAEAETEEEPRRKPRRASEDRPRREADDDRPRRERTRPGARPRRAEAENDDVPTFGAAERAPRAEAVTEEAPARRPRRRPVDEAHPDAPTTDRNYDPKGDEPRPRRRAERDRDDRPDDGDDAGERPARRRRGGRKERAESGEREERSAARDVDARRDAAAAPRRASAPTGFGLGVEAAAAAAAEAEAGTSSGRTRRGRRERAPRESSEARETAAPKVDDRPQKERAPKPPKAEASSRDDRPERDGKERSKGPKRPVAGENPRSESRPPRPSGFGQGI